MRKRLLTTAALVFALFAISMPIFAHHSQAVYDEDHMVTLKGVVTKFEWVNPHILIHLEVKDEKGNVEEWIAFSGSPAMQSREAGWTSEEFKSGEELTISGFPQKDGRRIMLGAKHIRANGEEIHESIAEQRIYQGYMDRRRKEAGKQ